MDDWPDEIDLSMVDETTAEASARENAARRRAGCVYNYLCPCDWCADRPEHEAKDDQP